MKELWKMFFAFARIGGLTFGGGYAMLPMLQKEVVEKNGWATEEELMDYYAIGQCTPGVIAVNTATFVGQKYRGTLGAIFATLGVVFPSMVIITLIAAFISNFAHLAVVQNAFAGVRVCVCVLIFLAVALGSYFANISPVFFVVIAAVLGILLADRMGRSEKNKGGAAK